MPKTRNIIIFTAIVFVFILIYIFFIKSPSDEGVALISSGATTPATSLQVTTVSSDNSLMANEFLTLLLSVKNIRLDDAIFSNPAFNSLIDSSITLIPDGNEGRVNPFAPIGTDIVVPPAAPSSPVTTEPPTIPTTPSKPPSAPATPPTTPPKPPSIPAMPKI